MGLDSYRLLTPLGVGRDGASYLAEAVANGTACEVRLLEVARANNERWPFVARRLRLATLLEHALAPAIYEVDLLSERPFVAQERLPETRMGEGFAHRIPLPELDVLVLASDLLGALAAAHRQGLVHGRLCPSTVTCAGTRRLRLDFSGLDVGGIPEPSLLDAACVPPEPLDPENLDPAADIYSLGALLWWLLQGKPREKLVQNEISLSPLMNLLQEMTASDPAARPRAVEARERLRPLLPSGVEATGIFDISPVDSQTVASTPGSQVAEDTGDEEKPPAERLGRFQIQDKLGQGGMGAVYRAMDPVDGKTVAIKVLKRSQTDRPDLLRRFHKEARLLAEVNNPHVTNLLEVNEDQGVHYLVMEYIAGPTLARLLETTGKLKEPTALDLVADAARGLYEAHRIGIIHRDIKPDNILLQAEEGASGKYVAKLSDFGLARHIVESESLNMTQAGAVMGTPLYMAPEQFGSGTVDARTDVYALGATLFHALTGRPPFQGTNLVSLMGMHRTEIPPVPRDLVPGLSEAVCQVVAKALAKAPEARYADAGALLRDLERLRRGEPAALEVHPLLPKADPIHVLHFDWVLELEASPVQLWPHVSNTERLNRAIGLSAVQFENEANPQGGTVRSGLIRKGPMRIAWRENPFEWIEGRRFGVLREYQKGPFKWLTSVVELTPRPQGGTTLAHRIKIEPRGLLGRTIAAVEVGVRSRRAVERVYRRIDAAVTGKLGNSAIADPFEVPIPLSEAKKSYLDSLLDRLMERGIPTDVVERLGEFVEQAPAQEVARIRPLALARRLGLREDLLVAACLHGAREGLFVLLWDLICPICRIPSQVQDTLRAVADHGHCPACRSDFPLDFGSSVELVFRAHPEVREADLGTYCIGGPSHSPHVVAQARLAPGECLELELAMSEGAYRLRGPQLPYTVDFRVAALGGMGRWEIDLSSPSAVSPTLRSGTQTLALHSRSDHELVVRVERTVERADALTAARASTLALFRQLFPGETLRPGQLVRVATMTFLASDLARSANLYEELGDARAFALVHEHFCGVEEAVRRHGGALVKTIGEGTLSVFPEAIGAVGAAMELATLTEPPRLAVHRGSALAATLNDHLDYFGATIKQIGTLVDLADNGEVVLGPTVAAETQCSARFRGAGWLVAPLRVSIAGLEDAVLQRARPHTMGKPDKGG